MSRTLGWRVTDRSADPGAPGSPPGSRDGPAVLCYSRHMASPTVAPDVVRPAAGESTPTAGPDAPVRIEVAMPRDLFDRLTDHDDAPRCRYDEHTGLAEFVAEPGVAHEGPAWAIGELVSCVRYVLAERGHHVGWQATGALRLLSDDGAFEADASFYFDATAARRRCGTVGLRATSTCGQAWRRPIWWWRSTAAAGHGTSSPPTSGWASRKHGRRIGRPASPSGRPMQVWPRASGRSRQASFSLG